MSRHAPIAAAALGLLLGLTACQTGGESVTPDTNPAAATASQAGGERGVASTDLADPAQLTGMSAPLVQAALGNPNFRRREHGVEIWQYYGQGCALDLFLYEQAGQQRVAHYQLRSRPPGTLLDAACYRRLVENR